MRASKVIFEYGEDGECQFQTFLNMTVDSAFRKFKKQYPEAIIYSIKTEY